MEVLARVLEKSAQQKRLLGEDCLVEVALLQKERDELIEELKSFGPAPFREEPLRSRIAAIIESDRDLYAGLEEAKADVAARISRVKSGFKAIKAYGG